MRSMERGSLCVPLLCSLCIQPSIRQLGHEFDP